jgi:hypothetical protein
MNYAIILVVDFSVFNMKTAPTKLTTVYTTLQQKVGLALIWLFGLNRKKLELCVCVCFYLFIYLFILFFCSMSNVVNRTQLLFYAKVRYNSLLTGFH